MANDKSLGSVPVRLHLDFNSVDGMDAWFAAAVSAGMFNRYDLTQQLDAPDCPATKTFVLCKRTPPKTPSVPSDSSERKPHE